MDEVAALGVDAEDEFQPLLVLSDEANFQKRFMKSPGGEVGGGVRFKADGAAFGDGLEEGEEAFLVGFLRNAVDGGHPWAGRGARDENFRAGGGLDENAAEGLDVQVGERGVAEFIDGEWEVGERN